MLSQQNDISFSVLSQQNDISFSMLSRQNDISFSMLSQQNDISFSMLPQHRLARHMAASLSAALRLRRKRRAPVAPLVPSLRLSHDDVAHCFASLALQAACACGAVGLFASLVT